MTFRRPARVGLLLVDLFWSLACLCAFRIHCTPKYFCTWVLPVKAGRLPHARTPRPHDPRERERDAVSQHSRLHFISILTEQTRLNPFLPPPRFTASSPLNDLNTGREQIYSIMFSTACAVLLYISLLDTNYIIQQGHRQMIKSDSKDIYILQKISISYKLGSFELSIHQRILKN